LKPNINININGQKVGVAGNLTILQAANSLGINIPTFCHDDRLIPHGACRICVVEVEGARNLVASCSTPVSEGMVIHTHSEKVMRARRDILALMIDNHPLDCLTCEKSGNCKLQDYCYEYDVKEGTFAGVKKEYEVDNSNEFYTSDQNKCILCGKCVRVCNELQCTGAIVQAERGFKTHIATPFEVGLEKSVCVSCGNCVSVCPVGSLMPKSREKFRQWEIKRVKTTCSYCGVGCQMELLVKENKVVGVEPLNVLPNNGLLCVKGKFGYKFINHPDRLKTPLIKKDGKFVEATWDETYELIVNKIKETKADYGPEVFGGFSSARCTNEENYLMQKLFRAVIGTNNIDHCARL
jgi:NADH-quinone oxidoreductase subunit G